MNARVIGSTIASAINPILEQLESRRLLSVALVNGQLQIKGSSGDDVITVDSNDFASRIRVIVNGSVRRFNTADVGTIFISGLKGDDEIRVADTVNFGIRTSIYGQDGNDTLIGGAARDAIFGGAGNDKIAGAAGNDSLRGESGD